MGKDNVGDFIDQCEDLKLKKYLQFRYTQDYKKRLERDKEERADKTREDRLTEMENKRVERPKPA